MKQKLQSLLLLGLAVTGAPAFAADVIVTGKINASTTWSADNRYLLNGYVFVTNGATLTIEPGTIVQG
ncbi:MAG: T9SS C-terminal target domain-containing protein, partial [Opitutaceae bacterium]